MTQKGQKQKPQQLQQEARIEYITQNMLYLTQEEIADNLGVSRKTICRDLNTWYDNKGFKDFIISQFLENYGKAKTQEKPIKLLDRIITMFKYLPPETATEAYTEMRLTWNLDKLKYLQQNGSSQNNKETQYTSQQKEVEDKEEIEEET